MERSSESSPRVGREPVPFGKYLLLERISVGGMAEVFKAKTFGVGGFEKVVALKRILPSLAEDAEFVEMFVDEAKICGQLQHANIGQVYELGRVEETHFIAMEYIWGRDLLQVANRLRKQKRPLDPRLVALIGAGACDGLDYAHRKKDPSGRWLQIIHRDISPQNLLVSFDGEIKIVDFGIAKAALRNSRTQAGVLKGKFGYMSPEQVRGLPIDRRSDIFALGIILWELLTGDRLFTGDTDFETLERVKNGRIPVPSTKNTAVPGTLDSIVMRALERGVEDRFAWASEMREALLHFVHEVEGAISGKQLAAFMRELFASDLERAQAGMPAPPPAVNKKTQSGKRAPDLGGRVVAPQRDGEMRTLEMPAPQFEEGATMVERGWDGGDDASEPGTNVLDPLELEAIIQTPSESAPTSALPPPRPPVDPLADTARPGELERILFADASDPHNEGTRRTPPPPDPFGGVPKGTIKNQKTVEMQAPVLPITAPDRKDAPTVLRPAPNLPVSGPAPVAIPTPTSRTTGAIPTIPPRSTLVRDLAIGAVLAIVVLGGFVGGQAWYNSRAASGTLVVMASATEAFDVDIDGRNFGQVDGSRHLTIKDLPSGSHAVVLRGKSGARIAHTVDVNPHDVTVFSAPAQPSAAAVPQETGKLRLQVTTPGSKVEVDGALLADIGTDQPIALRAGTPHEVRVKKPGYRDIILHVTLKAGEEIVKEVDFPAVPPMAKLDVRTDPPGAEVRIDGKKRGVTPLIVDGFDPKKPLRVTLSKHGFLTTTKQVPLDPLDVKLEVKLAAVGSGVAASDDNVIEPVAKAAPAPEAPAHPDAPMTPKSLEEDESPKNPNEPGFLIANTQPWARVFVDGRDTGKTTPIPPRSRISLKPGKHAVTFVVANKKYNFNVLIRAGEETRLLEQLGED